MNCPFSQRNCIKNECELWMELFKLDAYGKPIKDEKENPIKDGACSIKWNALLLLEKK